MCNCRYFLLTFSGNWSPHAIAAPDHKTEFLLSRVGAQEAEPYLGTVTDQMVRIKGGAMRTVEGCLLRKDSEWRLVLTLALIHQHVSLQMDAKALEPFSTEAGSDAPSRFAASTLGPLLSDKVHSGF